MGEAGDRAKSARALVEKINRAWLEKRPEDLSAFFLGVTAVLDLEKLDCVIRQIGPDARAP